MRLRNGVLLEGCTLMSAMPYRLTLCHTSAYYYKRKHSTERRNKIFIISCILNYIFKYVRKESSLTECFIKRIQMEMAEMAKNALRVFRG